MRRETSVGMRTGYGEMPDVRKADKKGGRHERDTDNINGFNFMCPADPAGVPRKYQQQAAVCTLAFGGGPSDDTGFRGV